MVWNLCAGFGAIHLQCRDGGRLIVIDVDFVIVDVRRALCGRIRRGGGGGGATVQIITQRRVEVNFVVITYCTVHDFMDSSAN